LPFCTVIGHRPPDLRWLQAFAATVSAILDFGASGGLKLPLRRTACPILRALCDFYEHSVRNTIIMG